MVNDRAVVATSNSTKYTEKGTYNSIPVDDVLLHIASRAVSSSRSTEDCPNSYDPLLLHFRIKSSNLDIYNQLADSLITHLGSKLLPSDFSYENKGRNLGMVPIQTLMGKVIIMVDMIQNNHILGTKMGELVNILGKSVFLRSLPYNDVIHTPDMDELIEFNKKNMTIGTPNMSYKSSNYNSSIVMQYGVQMAAMCFQTNDAFLQAYNTLFNDSAFILRDATFRFTPVHTDEPPIPNKKLSPGYTEYKSNYYEFKL